ncbi:MAG TPA: hypothetical protein VMR52_03845 [Dehalococcoidia bacterium]|nr:hypothetical protein [Dehalococcoidia bacterium]
MPVMPIAKNAVNSALSNTSARPHIPNTPAISQTMSTLATGKRPATALTPKAPVQGATTNQATANGRIDRDTLAAVTPSSWLASPNSPNATNAATSPATSSTRDCVR